MQVAALPDMGRDGVLDIAVHVPRSAGQSSSMVLSMRSNGTVGRATDLRPGSGALDQLSSSASGFG